MRTLTVLVLIKIERYVVKRLCIDIVLNYAYYFIPSIEIYRVSETHIQIRSLECTMKYSHVVERISTIDSCDSWKTAFYNIFSI